MNIIHTNIDLETFHLMQRWLVDNNVKHSWHFTNDTNTDIWYLPDKDDAVAFLLRFGEYQIDPVESKYEDLY